MYERGYNSPEPLEDESINPSEQVVNANLPKTSNLDNMTNESPAWNSNDASKKRT